MRFLKLALAALFLATQSIASFGQVYPVTTPVYIPSAVEAPTVCNTTCDVTFVISGVSTVSFQLTALTGTITASLQGTNEAPSVASPTWTTLNLTPFGGGSTVTSVSAIGMWTANTTGLTKIRAHISALSTGPVTVNLTGASGGTVTFSSNSVVLTDVEANIAPGTAPAKAAVVGAVYNSTPPTLTNGQTAGLQLDSQGGLIVNVNSDTSTAPDPCLSRGAIKSSAPFSITTATTTALVSVSGTKAVYVCSIQLLTPVTNTISFEYGTGTACASGPTLLTPVYPASTNVLLSYGGTVITAPASNGLCAVSTGTTTPGTIGVVTYVQQ